MRLAVNNGDLPRARQVHIDTRTTLFQLERFRVSIQLCFRDLLSFVVQFSERSAAESDIHPLARLIVTQVVSVVAVLDGLEKLKRDSVEYLDRAVLAAGNEQPILVRDVQRSLRLLQSGDRVGAFSGFEVDDFDRVVAERGNKEPLARDIQ